MSNISFYDCKKEIKKCPCCGFSADMIAYQHPMGYSHEDSWFKIKCCKCGMQTVRLSSERQALKTWNRRVDGR